MLSLLAVLLFAACNTDQEGPLYTEQGAGVSFSSSALTSTVVSPTDPSFTVDLFRAKAGAEYSGQLEIAVYTNDSKKTPIEGCTVNDYTFAADATMTQAVVNVSPIAIGQEVVVQLSMPEASAADVSVGGIAATQIVVSKDYTWNYLGEAYFQDNFLFYWYNNGVDTDENLMNRVKVKVYEAAEDPGRYQFHDLYKEYVNSQWDATEMAGLQKDTPTSVVTILTNKETGSITYPQFSTGVKFASQGFNDLLYIAQTANNPNDFIDGKRISIAPFLLIGDTGQGFDCTNPAGAFVITLP